MVSISQNYSGVIVLQDVMCSADATTADNCSFNPFVGPECSNPSRAVAIRCYYECKWV